MAILAATATLAGRFTRNRHLLSTIVALGLLTSSATIVHLSGGAIEAHFHFFVMMSVLLLYEDWLPYAAAFAYVVLHHGAVGVISPESVYNHPAAIAHPWRWAAIHGLFITAAGIANIANWRLNETARREAQAASDRAHLSDAALRSRLRQRADRRRAGRSRRPLAGREPGSAPASSATRRTSCWRWTSSRSPTRTASPPISTSCAAC